MIWKTSKYNRNKYCIKVTLFSSLIFKELANGKEKVSGLVFQKDVAFVGQQRNENTVYKLQDLYLDDILLEYCRMETVLDFAECFNGPNIMTVHTMLINKPPDSGRRLLDIHCIKTYITSHSDFRTRLSVTGL